MKKLLLMLAALGLLWMAQANLQQARAHGGNYIPPAGEVPPGGREPHDPQPPPDPPFSPPGNGGANTPPGGNQPPGSGGGAGSPLPPPIGGEGPGRDPSSAGPPTGGGVRTGRGQARRPKPSSFENWYFWWAYNRDEILNVKAAWRQKAQGPSTKSSTHFFGRGSDRNRNIGEGVTQRMIQESVVPALEQVVENCDIHPDIRSGALIALARCGGLQHVGTFFEAGRQGAGQEKIVQESALLALGILQVKTPEIREYLIRAAEDDKVPARARCFALTSLGLLRDNSPETLTCIRRRLDGRESVNDVQVCAIIALGLIGDRDMVPEMLDWLFERRIGPRKLSNLELAHVIGSLGRIGDPSALKAVERELRRKRLITRRSAMIAMGQIVPNLPAGQQAAHVTRLLGYISQETDLTAKNFGRMSLGRIAGHKDASDAVREMAVSFLKTSFREGGLATERPYAALALGLAGMDSEPSPEKRAFRYELAECIRAGLAEGKGDKVALGALAISLGMLGDERTETVDLLTRILEDRGLPRRYRGSAAIGLGLCGSTSAKAPILKALGERSDRSLRTDTAVAAGLLGDTDAVEFLIGILNDPRVNQFECGSVALALGQIGDAGAVPVLLKILQSDRVVGAYPDLTRALVTVALGRLADRRDVRVLFRITKDINYRASVNALDELLTIM